MKVGRAIADEPVTTAYPALLVSLGSGVSIIKVGGGVQEACRVAFSFSLVCVCACRSGWGLIPPPRQQDAMDC